MTRSYRHQDDVLDDAETLTYEYVERAVERIGMTPAALSRALYRAGRPDLARRFRSLDARERAQGMACELTSLIERLDRPMLAHEPRSVLVFGNIEMLRCVCGRMFTDAAFEGHVNGAGMVAGNGENEVPRGILSTNEAAPDLTPEPPLTPQVSEAPR